MRRIVNNNRNKEKRESVRNSILASTIPYEDKITNSAAASYVKLPVLLSSLRLNITVNSSMKFKEKVTSLQRVKRRVRLTGCRSVKGTKTIFIDGIIKEDIEYIADYEKRVKHKISQIPINFTANIKSINEPVWSIAEYAEEANIQMLNDTSLFSITEETLNEIIFCELEKNIVTEVINIEHKDKGKNYFDSIERILDVELFIKLYQNQLVKL